LSQQNGLKVNVLAFFSGLSGKIEYNEDKLDMLVSLDIAVTPLSQCKNNLQKF